MAMPYRRRLAAELLLVVSTMGAVFATTASAESALAAAGAAPRGYTFSRWPNGWRKLPGDDSPEIFAIEASGYGFTLNLGDFSKAEFGPADPSPGYEAALEAPAGDALARLPPATLVVEVEHGGIVYRAVRCRAATARGPKRLASARLWESGRYVQHFDFEDVAFVSAAGAALPCAAELGIVGWPESLTFTLRIAPRVPLVAWRQAAVRLRMDGAEPICAAERSFVDDWPAGEVREVSATWRTAGAAPPDRFGVTVTSRSGDQTFPVAFDASRACLTATVAGLKRGFAGGYRKITDYDELLVTIDNPGAVAGPVPFLLHLRNPANITGLCPILCDTEGRPTGIPVQLSKNWHQGQYLMAYAMLPAVGDTVTYLLRIPYGFYGTLPSASHAQLSLVGYGGNGRWDQLAIGCAGETFCLDLDSSLVEVAITDVRMLFTRAGRDGAMWGWSDAGWGGDWLSVRDPGDRKLPLHDLKAAYLAHGPCLTDVRYAGGYGPRHEVGLKAQVQTLRTDDHARTIHRLAYTFHAEAEAATTRFFSQGGGYGYVTPAIAYGNRDGLVAETAVPPDAKPGVQLVDRLTLPGGGPWWVAFPDASTRSPTQGAGSRGLVIRSYSGTFGGTTFSRPTITMPVAKVRGDGGGADAHLHIVPPAEVERIRPGDRVELEVEWITLPRVADDYYGPNEAFRAHLAEHPGSWQTVFREAAGNALDVTAAGGTVLRTYPIVIRAEAPQVTVTIKGGVGCVPIRFEGLPAANSHRLFRLVDGEERLLDQSVHGNDFWQVDRDDAGGFSRAYNLPLDGVAESTWILRE